jgi:transposase, IS5 family
VDGSSAWSTDDPMGCFVRLMVIKQRTGWGYQTLVREVSDSLHLRRFCLLPLTQRVPDESTVRKLVRRLGLRRLPS